MSNQQAREEGAAEEEAFPHSFKVKSFKRPTKCGVCGKLLLGLVKQGLCCGVCGLPVHSRCKSRATGNQSCHEVLFRTDNKKKTSTSKSKREPETHKKATKTEDPQEDDQSYSTKMFLASQGDDETEGSLLRHAFDTKTFTKPTDCAVCEKLLLGIVKQGVQCKDCGTCVHRECIPKADQCIACLTKQQDHQDVKVKKRGVLEDQLQSGDIQTERTDQGFASTVDGWASSIAGAFQKFDQEVDSWSLKLNQGVQQTAKEWEEQAKVVDEALDQKFNEYSKSTQETFDKVKEEGFGNYIVRGLKRGTDNLATSIRNLGDRAEMNLQKQESLEIDDDILQDLEKASAVMEKVGTGASSAAAAIRSATARGVQYIASTKAVKEFLEDESPDQKEMRERVKEGLVAAGSILNQVYDSVGELGKATGESVVRTTRHVYGDKAGKAARSSCDIAGAGYTSYATLTGALSGSLFYTAPVRSAPLWTLKEPCVFDGCMYATVYKALDMKAATPLQKIVKASSDALSGKEMQELVSKVELAIASQGSHAGTMEVSQGPISVLIESELTGTSSQDPQQHLAYTFEVNDASADYKVEADVSSGDDEVEL